MLVVTEIAVVFGFIYTTDNGTQNFLYKLDERELLLKYPSGLRKPMKEL